MRKYSLLTIFLCSAISSFSQQTEIAVRVGSGFYFFSGKSAVAHQNSFDVLSISHPYTRPYGKLPAFSVTVGGALKRVTKGEFLFGAGAEFQSLSSRSSIDTVFVLPTSASSSFAPVITDGKNFFRGSFISLSPFFGKRFQLRKVSIDISAGPELAFVLNSHEKIDIKSEDYNIDQKRDVYINNTDIRLHFLTEVNIKKTSFFAGYARGLINYPETPIGGPAPEAYSNFISIGVSYRLK